MSRQWSPTTVRTVDLGYEQLLVLQGRPGTRVRVLYGSAWLTEEGRSQDLFAASGGEVALHARGRTVIEGLGVARVQVIEPKRGVQPVRWLHGRVQGLAQRLAAKLPAFVGGAVARRA